MGRVKKKLSPQESPEEAHTIAFWKIFFHIEVEVFNFEILKHLMCTKNNATLYIMGPRNTGIKTN